MTVERLGEVVEAEIVPDWRERAQSIKGHLGRAVEGIVSAGCELIEAKAEVAHGEWLPMLEEIGIDQGTASRLMQISRNPAIANHGNCHDFPAAMRALYELSRMDPSDIEHGIETGAITPKTTIKEAREYAQAQTARRMSVDEVVNMVMGGAEIEDAPPPMPRTKPDGEEERRTGLRKAMRLGLMAVHQIALFENEQKMREALTFVGEADDVESTALTPEAIAKARTFLNILEEHI